MSSFRQALLTVLYAGVIGLAGSAMAEDIPTNSLTVCAGAVFYDRPELDSFVLVDFPFTLNRHEFQFISPDSATVDLEARIHARMMLYDVAGAAIDSAGTYFTTVVSDQLTAQTKGYRLFNSISLLLRPGVYSGRLTVTDVTSKRVGSVHYEKIVVEAASRTRLAIGGVCLAYSISEVGEAAKGDRLVRNGFRVLPNPLRMFGPQDSTMYLYAEIYNLASSQDSSLFRTSYVALDEAGAVYRDFGEANLPKPGSLAVIAQSFSIGGWPAGVYRLRMIVWDMTSNEVDTTVAAFTIVSAARALPAIAAGAPQGDPLDTLSLETQLCLIRYLLTPVERKALEALTDVGKQSYIRQYWQEHDSDPGTSVNENRRQMYERFLMCNHLFSTDELNVDGWSTDRGRVYMVYGPWEARDDIQAPRTGNPFEVWFYHSMQQGVYFVFEDSRGNGDYRLVHSNGAGERFNSEWDDVVQNGDYNVN